MAILQLRRYLSRNAAAAQADQEAGTATAKFVTPASQQYHPSAAKAWAHVTVTTGTPTLQTSFNITGIVDVGVGDLTITINTDFSSSSWSAVAMTAGPNTVSIRNTLILARAAGSVELACINQTPAAVDPTEWNFAGFGDQ